MDRELLDEIIKIRKTLEDIEFILEYAHVPQSKADIDLELYNRFNRNRVYLEAPLESLRTALNNRRQSSNSQIHTNKDQ